MKNRIIKTIIIFLVSYNCKSQNVGIGTSTPNASAQLDVSSTNSGFLPPRMTYAQRNAIVNPAAGLIVYCTDCANGEMQYYNGTGWINMSVGIGSVPFTTPIVSTRTTSSITSNGAISGGNISSDGGANITARGVCWSTSVNPTIALATKTNDGNGIGLYTSTLTGLTANTTYHVRAYATNSVGTSYGGDSSFTTLDSSFSTTTTTTIICNQIWMNKNLDVSTYRNGDPIPLVTDAATWYSLTTGAYCYYNNDSATYAAVYGKLYNWYAVNDPRGLAPTGYHIPSDAEWTTLVNCLGGSAVAGGAMKEAGLLHWYSPNYGATNSSFFGGLPGGYRGNVGHFDTYGNDGFWWTSTESLTTSAWDRYLDYSVISIYRNYNLKSTGCSVRCIKD